VQSVVHASKSFWRAPQYRPTVTDVDDVVPPNSKFSGGAPARAGASGVTRPPTYEPSAPLQFMGPRPLQRIVRRAL
jgi:hypothetical protein